MLMSSDRREKQEEQKRRNRAVTMLGNVYRHRSSKVLSYRSLCRNVMDSNNTGTRDIN